MKSPTLAIRSFIAAVAAGLLLTVPGQLRAQLLMDFGNFSGDPSVSDFVAAGVTEDLSGAVLASMLSQFSGDTFNVTPNLAVSYSTAASGTIDSSAWTSNNLLKDYVYIEGTNIDVSISGLNTELVYTGPAGLGFTGNSFTLQPSTSYFLYLFGAGDADNQNSTFTVLPSTGTVTGSNFGTTSPTIIGSDDDSHFVKFEFTTPSDLTGYTLAFNWANSSSSFGALNGLAIVAVPEPGAFGAILLAGVFFVVLLNRRRLGRV